MLMVPIFWLFYRALLPTLAFVRRSSRVKLLFGLVMGYFKDMLSPVSARATPALRKRAKWIYFCLWM